MVDNQDKVEIHVLQGEREIAAENKSLGKFDLVGIPPAPRGVPQIDVTFAIDSNGIVNVAARDMATNRSQSVQINPAGGLSKEEIDRLLEEAEEYSREDADRRELRRLKNRLEGLIYTNERVFDQLQETVDDDTRTRIREIILKSRMSLASGERADLEAAMFDLSSVSRQLSEFMLQQPDSTEQGDSR